MIRVFNKAFVAGALLMQGPELLASGFVKGQGEHYQKVSQGRFQSLTNVDKVGARVQQDEVSNRYYGEWGLSTGKRRQLAVSLAHKSLINKDKNAGDSHRSDGLGDTELVLKQQLWQGSLSGFQVALAGEGGFNLPTTHIEYSAVGFSQRSRKETPNTREGLVGYIDYGTAAFIGGVGASVARSGVWMNLGYRQEVDHKFGWREHGPYAGIGIALPWQSWFQVSYKSHQTLINSGRFNDIESSDTRSVSYGAGLGYTFLGGTALELSYNNNVDPSEKIDDYASFEVGLSHRSL